MRGRVTIAYRDAERVHEERRGQLLDLLRNGRAEEGPDRARRTDSVVGPGGLGLG